MNDWVLAYEGFDPDAEGERETLCTLGNGYFATRGALPESHADGVHYPGTYVAGVYNRLASEVSGRVVENESIVNVPNWLPVTFRAEGGSWFDCGSAEVLAHHQELDIYGGVLTRRTRFRDDAGRILQVTQRRFVSMSDAHLAALETTLVAENWSGRLEVHSALDGTVRNCGVARYAALDDVHLAPVCTDRENDEVVCLHVETNQSHVRIAEAARTRVRRAGRPVDLAELVEDPGYVALRYVFEVAEGEEVVVEKTVSLFTSRDLGILEPAEDACDRVMHLAGDFDELLERHALSWRQIWGRTRFDVVADDPVILSVHLHVFHLLQTASNNSIGLDVGLPARGLHGEAYRGHVFWDEVFILPFLGLRFPQLARSLLLYRYHRMNHARRAAAAAGYEGAMFPWQSASNGREQTQTVHLNPVSGRWLPDASDRQHHVNAAIAYNVWNYYVVTHDVEFLHFYGAEMILEIARFWSSIATHGRALDRYEIKGVMGPDEYHERYPGREEPGLDNNAYTNIMAVWCLCRAFDVLDTLPPARVEELKERLAISEQELDRWGDVSRKMRVCFSDGGVIDQFEGYEQLRELDWETYRRKYGDIHRLDRILEAEGDSTNCYQVTKQADVMMLFYLLPAPDLYGILDRLGYDHDDQLIPRNIAYYEPRTAHGSTLSRVVHSWVHARSDRERSWQFFLKALFSDVDEVQRGTTKEGIHLGAMAGTLDILQRCYTRLEVRERVLSFDPVLPHEVEALRFSVRFEGHLVHLDFTGERAQARVDLAEGAPITVSLCGERRSVRPGEIFEIALSDPMGGVAEPSD